MSSQAYSKKTVAQLRAEKEQHEQEVDLGCRLTHDVLKAVSQNKFPLEGTREEHFNPLLVQADRACELLQDKGENYVHAITLHLKAVIHGELGRHSFAIALYRQADELFRKLDRRGGLPERGHATWMDTLASLGSLYLIVHQLEAAKQCFLRMLDCLNLTPPGRVNALQCMARYHNARKEWGEVIEYCEEGLKVLPKSKETATDKHMEERFLLSLADAAEERGDVGRAHEYDDTAVKTWRGCDAFAELAPCHRRKAAGLLASGQPDQAVCCLAPLRQNYVHLLKAGICFVALDYLQPLMAALKVLAQAMMQANLTDREFLAGQIQADVEETEAILEAYREGVLEETRRELDEQRRAAMAPVVAAEGEERPTTKSKVAKRKQLKRKAKKKKRADERAEAAAAAQREEGTQGQDENGTQAQQAQEGNEQAEQDEGSSQHVVAPVAGALAAMTLAEEQDEKETEEEVEEECSVCLNPIDSSDVNHPVGPLLVCGHRYHAFCLQFWVERCTSKCIEPTCPYCRSPVQEVQSE